MAKVYGAAGEHAGKQSVTAFRRVMATLLVAIAITAFGEGVIVTTWLNHNRSLWSMTLVVAIGIILLILFRTTDRRVDRHETERMSWRKGALGEYEVGAELERLGNDCFVFNDINTEEFGNFDHIVVGPKGIFAIETKNWTGLIGTDVSGELTRNGRPSSQPYVRMLEQKVMLLREQILALTRRDDLFIRGVMVFPKACLEMGSKTRNVHCRKIDKLYDYFEKCPRRLQPDEVAKIARAVKSVAEMNTEIERTDIAVPEFAAN